MGTRVRLKNKERYHWWSTARRCEEQKRRVGPRSGRAVIALYQLDIHDIHFALEPEQEFALNTIKQSDIIQGRGDCQIPGIYCCAEL